MHFHIQLVNCMMYFRQQIFYLELQVTTIKKITVDFLLGFSEMKGEINNEIYLYQNPTMQSDQQLKSKIEYFSNYGFATRVDLNFNLFPYFGFNLAAQNVYTSRHNELNISVGLNIGLVQNKGKFKNKKVIKRSQRKPVL